MCNGELKLRAIYERDKHGGIRAAARAWGKTHGMIARAIDGGNSPTLRRLWDIPKNPSVPRLIINGCPPELKAEYLAMCVDYDMTRPALLSDMMRVYNDTMENMPY